MIDFNLRPIAIHLPQFHPIPENEEWWGKGFTEWTNVTKATPRFKGHYQPHLPADLGFYDLRLEEARLAQEALAKEYGIYGFCYYHYWFNGKRILHEPVDRKLKNPKEDLPFMLCWANENWTRAWDGGESEVLLKQEYSENDDREHIKFLIPIFKDSRYIKVVDKPVICIYKPDLFPDISTTLKIFREEAKKEGIELYICRFERWNGWEGKSVNDLGFDAAVDFQPLSVNMRKYLNSSSHSTSIIRFRKRLFKWLKYHKMPQWLIDFVDPLKINKDTIIDYEKYINFDLSQTMPNYKLFPGISPMWDNSSRRKNLKAIIFNNSTPKLFQFWYNEKSKRFLPFSKDENFLFINAWNEWAEGNHLEPCQKWGTAYLDALK